MRRTANTGQTRLGRVLVLILCVSPVTVVAQAQRDGPSVKLVITGTRGGDSASMAAAARVREELARLASPVLRVSPAGEVDAIIDVGYGPRQSASRKLTVGELAEIGRLLRATYVVDVALREQGSGVELSAIRIDPRSGASPVELTPVRGKDLGAVSQTFASRLAAETMPAAKP